MANKFFPVSIDLNNKNVLIVGAGKIAFRKIKTLIQYNCQIKIISKNIAKDFEEILKNKNIEILNLKTFDENILDKYNFFLIIAATNDDIENNRITQICKKKNILVNNISSKDEMNIRFCSIYENEDFQISVSANGNPKKSLEIKNMIKEFIEKNEKNNNIFYGGKFMKKIINTVNAPAAIGPYSQAVEINNTLYVSGQIPFVPSTMQLVSDCVEEQTKQCLENIAAILSEASYSFENVVKATVFIKSMDDFAKINSVYEKYLGNVRPARACVEVSRLPKDVKVEIEVIAVKD